MKNNRKIILVTDGDKKALKAVELAAKNIGGRCISRSAGNPTELTGNEIVELIKIAKYDPVVIMVDDRGDPGFGKGEAALKEVIEHSDIDVLGVVAVASNTENVMGIKVNFSIDCKGDIVYGGVDKNGIKTENNKVYGDTVDIINEYDFPYIVGVGDVGKMDGKDDCKIGAPIITKALKEIMDRSSLYENQ
ncbi:MAG: stage V sporulation protein AE [Firmicutes bacterium]|nr:stage V sporulation protein AE [Bacillota bacterium]